MIFYLVSNPPYKSGSCDKFQPDKIVCNNCVILPWKVTVILSSESLIDFL